MLRAAFLPCPTPTVTVRSLGTASPPAKTPGAPVIRVTGSTRTVSPSNSTPGTARRNPVSLSWPRARITVSAASFSNMPVPCGRPRSSSSCTSTVSSCSFIELIVRSQLIRMPSCSASTASSSWAGICALVRR